MPENEDSEMDRAERMVDFGLQAANVTFDLGKPVLEEDIDRAKKMLSELEASEE